MPRRCLVCIHEERRAIDRAILSNVPYSKIKAKWGVPDYSVSRHKSNHLEPHVKRAMELEKVSEAADLILELRELHVKTIALLDKAETAEDMRESGMFIREARANIELLARLRGEIQADKVAQNIIQVQYVDQRTIPGMAAIPVDAEVVKEG